MNVKHFAITAEYWGAPRAAVPQIEPKEWLKNQTQRPRRDRHSALPAKPRASLYCRARREKCAPKVYFEYKDVVKLVLHIFTAQPRSLSLLNDTKQVKYTVVLKFMSRHALPHAAVHGQTYSIIAGLYTTNNRRLESLQKP